MTDSIILPAEHLIGAQSFAIDFGGSVLKLAYLKKDDVHPEGHKRIHLKCFPRSEFQSALEYIKKECYITKDENGESKEYSLTGVGTHQYQKDFKEHLGIKIKTAWEMECLQNAFVLLTNALSDDDLYHAPEFVEDANLDAYAKGVKEFIDDMDRGHEKPKFETQDTGKFPAVFAILGSAFLFSKINEDATVVHGASSPLGGRSFLGLGSMLTGAKSFDEIVSLAEKGSDRNVHCYTQDMIQQTTEEGQASNTYEKLGKFEVPCFMFGWCVGKSLADFKPEDLACGLATVWAQNIVARCMQTCEKFKLGRIVLAGGFGQSAYTRKLIEKEFTKMQAVVKVMMPEAAGGMSLRTLKHGMYLGAIGAMLLKNKEHTKL